MDEAREQVLKGLEYCDILKISDNEIQWLTGIDDYADGVKWILSRYPARLVTVSLGKNGSMAFYRKDASASDHVMASADPFLQEDTIETTGAGDTFNGCILHGICQKGLDDLSADDLEEMLIFANAAASIITTRRGALYVMPEKDEAVVRSAHNIPGVRTALAANMNVYEIVNHTSFIVTKEAVEKIEEVYK